MSAHSLVSSTSTRMYIVALHVSVLYCGMYVPGIATCLYLELGCDCSVLHVHTIYIYTLVMEFRACVLREGMQK